MIASTLPAAPSSRLVRCFRRPLLLVLTTCVLAGCSADTNDRLWQRFDPLGHARATDSPFLYRGKDEVRVGGREQEYLTDP